MTVPQPDVKNFINGVFERNGNAAMDVISPLDGSRISTLPLPFDKPV